MPFHQIVPNLSTALLPGFKRDPSFFHPCTIHHCSRPNHKTQRDLLDQPCLLNQNLMSFILLMKYCQGLSEKHQRDKVAIRPLLLDIIEKIRHTNTNDHLPLTIKVCLGTIPILRQHILGLFGPHSPTHLISMNTVLNVRKKWPFSRPTHPVLLLT